jgi:amidohydrolase
LEERGFTVARGIAGLPTAFQAEAGSGRPAVAFLAEYDALPGLGHGCGHNLIALTAVGAGVGLRAALDGVLGTALVFGAPAEEACNGKAIMAEAGIFAGLDAAIGAHPGPGDAAIPTVDGSGVIHAAQGVQIAFRGKPAHAAADPYHGINALNALIETFNGINALRQHIRSDARIHGIVTHGGDAPNVVPAYAAGEFLVRSATMKAMNELVAKVRRIAEGAALMTGAELIFSFTDTASSDMITNRTLAKRIKRHLDQLGLIVPDARPEPPSGSSDWGNVSYQVPSVEIGYPIVRGDCAWHSPEVVAAADSDLAYHNAITVAKALALTGLDIVRDAAFRQTVSDEFAASARARVTE